MRHAQDDGAAQPAGQPPVSAKGARRPPLRRCLLTGREETPARLIRLAVGPDGALWPDLGARLPGRGVWITPDQALLRKAMASGKLRGAARHALADKAIIVADDLADRIGAGLAERALQRLGLEQRAGRLIYGLEKLLDRVHAQRIGLLLWASDAAAGSVARLEQALRVCETGESITLPVDRDALSAAIGRGNTPCCGVADAGAIRRIKGELYRWLAYLEGTG